MIDMDLIVKARNADLLSYLKSAGYQMFKSGRDEYRLVEHDSLVISNNKWNWFSRDDGGNTLDFLVKYERKTLPEAVKILTNMDYRNDIQPRSYETKNQLPKSYDKAQELKIPDKNPGYARVAAYLNKTRKIDGYIISQYMKQGKIYESKDHHNCVFLGTDKEGNVKFASERGTLSEKVFRRDCPGSDKRYSFCMEGRNDKLYVFESPIEALSHATIFKLNKKDYSSDHRLSLDGVEPISLYQYLMDRPEIKKVVLCLNNDKAGKDAADKIAENLLKQGYDVKKEYPRNKDFNDDLKELANNPKLEMVK